MRYLRPPWCTGSNGLPVATIARPSDQRIASSAVHSHFDVGFDSGKISGRSLQLAIRRMTFSVNVPGVAETPMRMDGFAFAIVSSSVMRARSRTVHDADSCGSRAYSALKSSRPARSLVTSPFVSTVQIRARASSRVSASWPRASGR
jgi:hypothetical protein